MDEYAYSSGKKRRSFGCLLACGFLTGAYLICLFHPVSRSVSASADSRAPASRAECVMDAESRRILYEYNGEESLPMASTTKILTAITVLENCGDLEETFEIPAEAEGVEGSSVYLKSGEAYSVKDLLYGLMLRSGNDCAVALALHTSGSIGEFSARMNETAQRAGALKSNFRNPHGLPKEGHYTTARDLSLIACYAMQNSVFREIVSTKYYEPCRWANKNKMLRGYDGAAGIKTGYTRQAGRCLVSAAVRDGMTLVCTVLNCPTMYERSKELLNDAFRAYKRVRLIGADTPVKAGESIGCTREDLYYPLLEEERGYLRMTVEPVGKKNNPKKDEIIAQMKIFLGNRLLFSRNLYKL